MDYLHYVMIAGGASLLSAGVCCIALWAMLPRLLARERAEAPEPCGEKSAPAAPADEAGAGGAIFDFTAEQAPALAKLLANESPDDIAVVLARMPASAGRALLAALGPELKAKVLLSLASPRSVDMELIRGMKTELENRLLCTVGGAAEAAAFIKDLPYGERRELLLRISSYDPARAMGLRGLFMLDEDLLTMADKDFKALAGAIPAEKMARFLPGLPDKLKAKIKEHFPAKTVLAMEKAAPSGAQGKKEKEAALAGFMEYVEKLAAKGVIARPRPRLRAQAAAPAAAKDDWG